VRKVSQVYLKQASTELQVVTLEWLGTTDNLAVHSAQVSQVDQVDHIPQACGCVSFHECPQGRHQDRQGRHMIWRAGLAAGFPFLMICRDKKCQIGSFLPNFGPRGHVARKSVKSLSAKR